MIEWGPEEAALESMASESGIVPHALLKKPTLDVVEIWYWDEFNNLAFDRRTDQGYPCAISTEQIETYCRFFDVEKKHEFHSWMRLIDRLYLKHYYDKKKKEQDSKPVKN